MSLWPHVACLKPCANPYMRRYIVIGIIVLIAAVFGVMLFYYDPETSDIFPKCPFYALTGLKCPGCGTQRALHDLLTGDFVAAMGHNAFLLVSVPLCAFYGGVEIVHTRCPRFYNKIMSPAAIWALLGVIVTWWIVRNIIGV